MDVEADRARYEADRAKGIALSAAQGIDAILNSERLKALRFPGASGAALSAPHGPGAFRDGAECTESPHFPRDSTPLSPFGISFAGSACSEPRPIELAYAFEQVTRKRTAPAATP